MSLDSVGIVLLAITSNLWAIRTIMSVLCWSILVVLCIRLFVQFSFPLVSVYLRFVLFFNGSDDRMPHKSIAF